MRACEILYRLVWVAALVFCFGALHSGEYVMAPKALGDVINPKFQQALTDHAPGYDDLDREDQVLAFIRVYKSLNRGQNPELTPEDAFHLGGPVVGAATTPPPPPPQSYVNPSSGDAYIYYPGYGYRRYPPPQPVIPPVPGTVGGGGDSISGNDAIIDEFDTGEPPRNNYLHRLEPRHLEPRHLVPRHLDPHPPQGY